MRTDPAGSQLTARRREPRLVVGIIFPFASIYVSNRKGITNVPGVHVQGALLDISGTSQTLHPDEGRAIIGSLSFTAVDLGAALTDELRTQLQQEAAGVRRREVRVFSGDTNDFTDGTWRRVETYVVDSLVEFDDLSYRFHCSDRQRELRNEIFEQARTRLAQTITDVQTTIAVEAPPGVIATSGFNLLQHTVSFTESPSAEVGYIRLRKTGEIVRYTGKTDTSFTGCTRGVFGTLAQPVEVDAETELDRKPEVEEFIYLEMPGPQLLYALMTGRILDTAITLPPRWHLGVSEDHVDASLFTNIGADLYDPDDLTKGRPLVFTYLKKTDGKRFIEEQVHVPMGTYSPLSAEGVLGLRRLTRLLADAAPNVILFPNNIISTGPLRHQLGQVINQIAVDWNFDGERYTRTDLFINQRSIQKHGASRLKRLQLRGLTARRHSRTVLREIFDRLTDRYGAPPQTLDVELSSSMNQIEIADIGRTVLGHIRDFAGLAHLDRSFEVQERRINWLTGDLRARLFGSSADMPPDDPIDTGPALDDAWYTSAGTDLATVLTITDDVVTANGTLTGHADLRHANAIYYYTGPLTIGAGVKVTIEGNVQLRIRGDLEVLGEIDGVGNGEPPQADPNTVGMAMVSLSPGSGLYWGTTRSGSGVIWIPSQQSYSGALTGRSTVGFPNLGTIPRLALDVTGGELQGLPRDIRGTRGSYGSPIIENPGQIVRALGGAGGASGAGLAIISRGLTFGLAGLINLSGANGSPAPNTVTLGNIALYGGGGAGGGAGALYVIVDGRDVVRPDVLPNFVANVGGSPVLGTLAEDKAGGGGLEWSMQPGTGRSAGFPLASRADAGHMIQYAPQEVQIGQSEDDIVPAPLGLAAVGDGHGVLLTVELPPVDNWHYIELFESIDNDRANAIRIARISGDEFFRGSDEVVNRFYACRALHETLGVSEWFPKSPTEMVGATFGGAAGADGVPAIDRAVSASAPLTFRQGKHDGLWSHDQVDITYQFLEVGAVIATRVIRVTRTGANLSAALQDASGAATTHTIIPTNNADPVLTIVVTHTASNVSAAESVATVQGGDQGDTGATGADGDAGADGADGIDAGNWVFTGTFSATDHDTVAWTAAVLKNTSGASQSINAGNTGNIAVPTFIFWNPVSPTVFQTTTTGTNAVGDGKIMIAVARPSASGSHAFFMVFGGSPQGAMIATDQLAAQSVTANVLAAAIALISDLSISSTSGKIRSGVSAFDGDGGFFLGWHNGEPALSIRESGRFMRYKPSTGIELEEYSLSDWGPTLTFSPSWGAGFSTNPSGSINYAISQDGRWAKLFWPADQLGTANNGSFSVTNLPSAIRPSGGGAKKILAVGIYQNGTGAANEIAGGAWVWGAGSGSAGVLEFARMISPGGSNPVTLNRAGWATSGSKGILAGTQLMWPL